MGRVGQHCDEKINLRSNLRTGVSLDCTIRQGETVGVIGPTRMPYEHVVALVGHVADTVGNVLARN